jgi:hypothetical protein
MTLSEMGNKIRTRLTSRKHQNKPEVELGQGESRQQVAESLQASSQLPNPHEIVSASFRKGVIPSATNGVSRFSTPFLRRNAATRTDILRFTIFIPSSSSFDSDSESKRVIRYPSLNPAICVHRPHTAPNADYRLSHYKAQLDG